MTVVINDAAKVIWYVRLAQLDRAFGYGPKGRGFESSNARYMCVYARFICVYARFVFGTQEALKNGHSCVSYFLNLGECNKIFLLHFVTLLAPF